MSKTKNIKQIREHWFTIVNCVFFAEHKAITDEDRKAFKNHKLSPQDYIYKVVDEILSSTYGVQKM